MPFGRDSQGSYTNIVLFKDFDIGFQINPVSGDVVTLTQLQSIEQSVRLLVLTQFYERAYEPYIGTKIAGLLFELPDSTLFQTTSNDLTDYINLYEPRVEVLNVTISPQEEIDSNTIIVVITYLVIGAVKQYTTTVNVQRIR